MDAFRLLENYLAPEEVISFACWAFGPDFAEIENGAQMVTAWNILHWNLYQLFISGSMSEDLPAMIELWRERGDDSFGVFEE
ncbi:MAG: hypothetical protein EHM34_00540 [Nitrosopumilales archaeon]|nr:MAG: hypothetical protein EHM34_00540 [Nitrosopumilales archaeon]